jgi:ribA/ribD-fused uncharacterized protein
MDWNMISVKQNNLADAMGFIKAGLGEGAVQFFDKFQRSGWMSRFEKSEGRATLGCSGSELALMVYSRFGKIYQPAEFTNKCNFDTITANVEYWIGYALGYLQGRSDIEFNRIFQYYPLEGWYRMFSLHEVSDEALWQKTLGRYIEDELDSEEPYYFGGRDHPFSNYYPSTITYEGLTFTTGEGAFQSAKTLDIAARVAFININPGAAKGKGRKLALRPDWEDVKYQVMLDVLHSKFQEPALRKMLLETGERVIIEDTTGWHDNIWGDCRCDKCRSIEGRNLLGKALMSVRADLRVCNRE